MGSGRPGRRSKKSASDAAGRIDKHGNPYRYRDQRGDEERRDHRAHEVDRRNMQNHQMRMQELQAEQGRLMKEIRDQFAAQEQRAAEIIEEMLGKPLPLAYMYYELVHRREQELNEQKTEVENQQCQQQEWWRQKQQQLGVERLQMHLDHEQWKKAAALKEAEAKVEFKRREALLSQVICAVLHLRLFCAVLHMGPLLRRAPPAPSFARRLTPPSFAPQFGLQTTVQRMATVSEELNQIASVIRRGSL